jgi:outer membrane immunogenic protein
MVRRATLILGVLGLLLLSTTAALAQEGSWSEVSFQGIGLFTKNSSGQGITQRATQAGGPLVGYRFHFNRWIAAEANYGYTRNTQQYITSSGLSRIQANIHEATGAFVVTPLSIARMRPYLLAGAGALVFDPRGDAGNMPGASRQTKPAFLYGGGVDYQLMRHVALRAEYRGLVYKAPDFQIGGLNPDVATHLAQPSAGIVFRF